MKNLNKTNQIPPHQSQQTNKNDKHPPKISSSTSSPNIPTKLYPPNIYSNNINNIFSQTKIPHIHPTFIKSSKSEFIPKIFIIPNYNQHLTKIQQLTQIYTKNIDQKKKYTQYIFNDKQLFLYIYKIF